MNPDRFLELVPLAALGVLDGDDRTGFDAHMPACVVCHAELAIYERVAGLLPLGLSPVAPGSRIRERVLGSEARTGGAGLGWPAGLALAASVVLGVGLLAVREQRDEAVAFRALVERRGARVTRLDGLAPAPQAYARVVWDPATREAVLVAGGLDPVPAGKAYQAWVIAGGAPVAAGVFRPDAAGLARLRLPPVADAASVRTFAVTLEPEAGVPAPTGPMVLAGGV